MITSRQIRPINRSAQRWSGWAWAAVELGAVYALGRLADWWWLAGVVVALVELRGLVIESARLGRPRLDALWENLSGLIMGLSVTLIIILVPRLVTQIVVAALYAAWLIWRQRGPKAVAVSMVNLLIVQGVMFEALFLMAAIWQTPSWFIVVLVWTGAYLGVYAALAGRSDKSAGVMAATWGVIAAEVSWVLLLWLITYTMHGGYVLVPQPALILTALAYVFGSILSSSRQGNLSRARLGEYLVIACILVLVVVIGTSWHGNV